MFERFLEFVAGCSPQANLNDPWGLPAGFQYTTPSNPPAHPSWYKWP
nr:hypothetical protein [Candidatus Sigynarchaeum springense]